MSGRPYCPYVINISDLPRFSIERPNKEKIRQKRILFLIRSLLIIGAMGVCYNRYCVQKNFTNQLVTQHHQMDQKETDLNNLKRIAFIDNNYKKRDFRQKYLTLHAETLAIKKEHFYQQTNDTINLIRKHNGICPECAHLKSLGIYLY